MSTAPLLYEFVELDLLLVAQHVSDLGLGALEGLAHPWLDALEERVRFAFARLQNCSDPVGLVRRQRQRLLQVCGEACASTLKASWLTWASPPIRPGRGRRLFAEREPRTSAAHPYERARRGTSECTGYEHSDDDQPRRPTLTCAHGSSSSSSSKMSSDTPGRSPDTIQAE